MNDGSEITRLQKRVEQLSAENAALREDGFRGSKAEALMALEYDRIPTVLKTARAIRIQRKVATMVMIIVPVLLVAIAIGGGINAYWDHQRSIEAQSAAARWGDDLRNSVDQSLRH
jgi:hypothetical protein